jgi:hypothetical protein
MKYYCGCDICDECKNEGGQRKDRSEVKSGGLGKIGDHGRVYKIVKMVG